MPEGRQKWTADKLPENYPQCSRRELNDAIKDLSAELVTKSIRDLKDFDNKGWKERVVAFIQIGSSELQHRNSNYALIATLIGLFISLIAIYISVASLKSSSRWEERQIQVLEKQASTQERILETIKDKVQAE
ncbi:hypothetical protein HY967_01235 [Candidatus Jorgensenbacteria bacterium]|nr:hypothetical protein [Candidatus Jorgensenbacteria bacterium]